LTVVARIKDSLGVFDSRGPAAITVVGKIKEDCYCVWYIASKSNRKEAVIIMVRSAELAENVIKVEEVKQETSVSERDQMGHFTTSSLSSLQSVKQESNDYEKDQVGHVTTSSLSSLQSVKQESNDYEKDQVGHVTTSSLSSLQSEGDKPRSLKRDVKQERKEELVCADDQQQQQQERVEIPLQISQKNPKKRKQNPSVQGAGVKKPTTQGTLQDFEESLQKVREAHKKLMECFKKGEELFARQNELRCERLHTFCQYCQNSQYMGELNYVPNPNDMEIVIRF
ncbi:Protein of unknown function, partial [Gryllus bimaculatus]